MIIVSHELSYKVCQLFVHKVWLMQKTSLG